MYPGKSSATTSGCSARNAFTARDLLWMPCRSHTTVNGPRNCRRNVLQEGHHILGVDRLVDGQQLEVQPRPPLPRTEGDATDGRDPVATVPGLQHRRPAAWGQRPAHRRRQPEARFVEEDDVGLAFPGFSEDARQLIGLPALHLLVVAFAGLALGLLAGPAQSLLEDLADVLGVVGDAEAFADEPGDAVGGPQFVVPAVFLGALEKEAFEFAEVVVGQPGRGAGDGPGVQAVGLAGHASPAVQGGDADAEDAGDRGGGFALLDEFHGAATAAFQFAGVPLGLIPLLYSRPPTDGAFSHAGLSKTIGHLLMRNSSATSAADCTGTGH